MPLSLHHLGGFLFGFYFASWSKEEGGGRSSAPPLLPTPSLYFFLLYFSFSAMKTEGSGVMRLAMAFVLGLGGALAWRDSTLAKSRVGIFFFPSPCSQRCTGSSRPASEMDMGTSWKPQPPGWGLRRIRSAEGIGVSGPPPGVCAKIKN